jgi:hypothetical protein
MGCAVKRDLVTQRRHVDPCANSPDGATATRGPGRRLSSRGSSLRSRVWRASVLGWRLCWPFCRRGPSSNAGDDGYVDRDEITSDSTCIYGDLHEPWRPPLRGRIITQADALSGLDAGNEPPHARSLSRHLEAFNRPVPATAAIAKSNRWFSGKFRLLLTAQAKFGSTGRRNSGSQALRQSRRTKVDSSNQFQIFAYETRDTGPQEKPSRVLTVPSHIFKAEAC